MSDILKVKQIRYLRWTGGWTGQIGFSLLLNDN